MAFCIEFDDGESYHSDGPAERLGSFGYLSLKKYSVSKEEGMVILDFGTATRKIPSRCLVRITEG